VNILFLSGWFPYPPDNGARLRVYNMIQQLATHHEIALLSFAREGRPTPKDTPITSHCRVIGTVPFQPFQPYRLQALLGLVSPQPRSLTATRSPEMEAMIQRALRAQAYDLVIASEIGPGTGMSSYARDLARACPEQGRRIPCVVEDLELSMIQGGIRAQRSRLGQWRRRLTWWKLKNYIPRLLQDMAGCTVASAEEKRLVEQLAVHGFPVAVVPNGVDVNSYAGDFGSPEPDSLIFSGALTYGANWEAMQFFLTQVFPLVKAQRPDTTLRITGHTDGTSQERLPQQPGVIFTGYLEDVRPAIAQSWISVVPLRRGGGTRLKILEAMALGTPVVATAKGAEGIEARPGQDLLVADDPASFAQAVVRLLANPALRQQLSSNGRRLVKQQYDWKAIGARFDAFLQKVMVRCRR